MFFSVKFEVYAIFRCWAVAAFWLLIRYVTLRPLPLIFWPRAVVSGHTWRVTWSPSSWRSYSYLFLSY